MTADPRAEAADLDGLRRDLYRPGAGEDALRRYTVLRDALGPTGSAAPETAATADGPARPRGPHRRIALTLGAIAIVAVAIGAGLATTARTAVGARGATPVPVRTVDENGSSWSIRFNGDTAPTAPAPSDGSASAAPQSDGTTSGVVDGVGVIVQRFHGTGPGGVHVQPTAGSGGGRIVVALSSASATHLRWRAGRPAFDDGSTPAEVVARGTAVTEDRSTQPSAVVYTGAPPQWVRVDAPDGAAWHLAVVLLPPDDRLLR